MNGYELLVFCKIILKYSRLTSIRLLLERETRNHTRPQSVLLCYRQIIHEGFIHLVDWHNCQTFEVWSYWERWLEVSPIASSPLSSSSYLAEYERKWVNDLEANSSYLNRRPRRIWTGDLVVFEQATSSYLNRRPRLSGGELVRGEIAMGRKIHKPLKILLLAGGESQLPASSRISSSFCDNSLKPIFTSWGTWRRAMWK